MMAIDEALPLPAQSKFINEARTATGVSYATTWPRLMETRNGAKSGWRGSENAATSLDSRFVIVSTTDEWVAAYRQPEINSQRVIRL